MQLRRPSLIAVAHLSILLAAVVPGAMVTSLRSVYLVTVAELDPFIVGTFNYVTSILGIVLVYYAGRGHIDRMDPIRLQLLAMSMFVLGSLSILWASSSPLFLVAAALFGAVASIGASSIFVYDERYGPRGDNNAGLFRTRLLISVAWIVGPPLSYVAFWLAGFEAVIIVTTAMVVFAGAAMLVVSKHRLPLPKIEAPPKPVGETSAYALGFWPIFIAMVATTSANVLHAINLPLYLIETRGVPVFWPGLVMAAAAGVEVVVIAALPRLTNAVSDTAVLWGGLVLGVIYFALLNVITDPAAILALQLIYGGHFAATTVVCLPLLRRALSGGTGSLAAQFNNASRIGGILGSVLFAVLASQLGYHGILVVLCEGLLITALLVGAVRWMLIRRQQLSVYAAKDGP